MRWIRNTFKKLNPGWLWKFECANVKNNVKINRKQFFVLSSDRHFRYIACKKVCIVQALISVQALVFDLAQLTCQKRFGYRNAMLRSSAILLGTS